MVVGLIDHVMTGSIKSHKKQQKSSSSRDGMNHCGKVLDGKKATKNSKNAIWECDMGYPISLISLNPS